MWIGFVLIWLPTTELKQNNISTNFESPIKTIVWNGTSSPLIKWQTASVYYKFSHLEVKEILSWTRVTIVRITNRLRNIIPKTTNQLPQQYVRSIINWWEADKLVWHRKPCRWILGQGALGKLLIAATWYNTLTNCGLVNPCGNIDLGQHWLR